ncbi:hypothetical protein [Calderihabitans maritimus]|uniref:Peptidase S8/S53 subtilisin kexin sedolisin n=1 Tax=Calderihabitans maritimus TaxID=1246530 RepID=A0A1Z5HNY9_9FIRM|nr:hypothetical protein [Calderihabitans maritimus]GAW91249.1 peptidase S8/S53 subtilisin kexin sedolisin [Calderihabitans maritimus]
MKFWRPVILLLLLALVPSGCTTEKGVKQKDLHLNLKSETALPTSKQTIQPIRLSLSGYQFDPLKGEPTVPPSLDQGAWYSEGKRLFLVQLKQFGPEVNRWKEQARNKGMEFLDFTEVNTYLVCADSNLAADLRQDDFVRAIVDYKLAYKLSQEILSEWENYVGPPAGNDRTCALSGSKHFLLRLRKPGDREAVAEAVRENNGRVLGPNSSQSIVLNIVAPPQILPKIVHLPQILGVKVAKNTGSAISDDIVEWDFG